MSWHITTDQVHGLGYPWPTFRAKSLARFCVLPNLMAETWGYTASAPLSLSLDFHQSINPTSLLMALLPSIHSWPKVVTRVQMKTCSQLVGRGLLRGYTASSEMCHSNLNNTHIISGLLPGIYPPYTKQPALAFYFISILSFVHHIFFFNGTVVIYVQVFQISYHTFYNYCFVIDVFPCRCIVRCTNSLNVLLT